MTPSIRSRLPRRARQGGLSLVTAIFLVVVLSGLAGVIVNLSISQQSASSQDVLGVRAYQAARAGIEWGLYQQLRLNSCPTLPTTLVMPAGTTLSNFTVIVQCTPMPDNHPSATGITRLAVNTTVTPGSATLVVDSTTGLVERMRIHGTGIAPGTVIASIDSATGVTMSRVSTASSPSLVSLNYYSPLDQFRLVSTACNLPTGGLCSNAGTNADYVQRVMQVQF